MRAGTSQRWDAKATRFRDDAILVRLEVAFAKAFTTASMRTWRHTSKSQPCPAVPPGVVAGH
jgi:uncharacterized protein GlcG (DUF336 family)